MNKDIEWDKDYRLINSKARCQHLSDMARRCKKIAKYQGAYHGNPKTAKGWVVIQVCEEHAKKDLVWYGNKIPDMPAIDCEAQDD